MSLRTLTTERRFRIFLLGIALCGLALRFAYDIKYRGRPVGSDGFRYHYGAILLADGHGFVAPLIYALRGIRVPDTGHPPAWTIVLAGATKVGLRSWFEHQLVASVVGTATIVMTGLAARAAFGRRTGLIAAALAACYPFLWLYEREVLSESFALLLVATVIWLAYKFRARPSIATAVALGTVVGVLSMTKSDQLAILVFLIVPLVLFASGVDLRRRLTWLACAVGACVLVLAPWSLYLTARLHQPVVLAGAIGGTMAAGNCDLTYHGKLLGYYDPSCVFTASASDDPIENDAQARERALTYMRAHATRAPVVILARVGRTFGVFRPQQQMHLETVRGTSLWVFRFGFIMYWVLLPLAISGAIVARRRLLPIYPLLVFPGVVVLTVLLTIGSVRYRAPAEISLAILSAYCIKVLLDALHRRGTMRWSRSVDEAGGDAK